MQKPGKIIEMWGLPSFDALRNPYFHWDVSEVSDSLLDDETDGSEFSIAPADSYTASRSRSTDKWVSPAKPKKILHWSLVQITDL